MSEIIDYNKIFPIKIENYFSDIYLSYYENNKKKYSKIPFQPYYYTSNINSIMVKKEDCEKKICDSAYKIFEMSFSENKKTYQADLKLHKIFMLEKFLNVDILKENNIKVGFLDIENYVKGRVDVTADTPITAISVLNSDDNKIHSFVYSINNTRKDDINNIYIYDNEYDMLCDFLRYMKLNNFDVITGWNCKMYDLPVICFRLQKYGILEKLSPFGLVKQKFKRNEFDIYGISVLDYLPLYKKYKKSPMTSYSLDYISNYELKKSKVKYEGTLNDLWKDDIDKFIEYNRTDVLRVKEIEDKLQFIKLANEIRNISFVNFEEVLSNSIVLDNLFLRKMNKEGYVLTSKKEKDYDNEENVKEESEKSYAGAYVKEPRPGIRNFVIDLDCESQYPSAIMYLNISPETKMGKIVSGFSDIFYFSNDDDKEYEVRLDLYGKRILKLTERKLKDFLITNKYVVSANGSIFLNKETKYGFIPQITEWIFFERKKYKKLMLQKQKEKDEKSKEYDIKQQAYKELTVSIYGFLGFSSSRFFDVELAEAITLSGQKIVKKAIKLIEDKNYDVIATDTDSLLISFPLNFDNMVGEIIESDIDNNYIEIKYNLGIIITTNSMHKNNLDSFCKQNKCFHHGKYLYNSNLYDTESAIKIGHELGNYIDSELKKFLLSEFNSDFARFHFKNEFVADRGVFFTKKKYVLHIVYNEGNEKDELHFRGVEVRRTDTPEFAKKYLNKIYETLLKTNDFDKIDTIVDDYKKCIHLIDKNELGIPSSIKDIKSYDGEPIHVRGAKLWEKFYAEKANAYFSDISKGKYYFLDCNFIPEYMNTFLNVDEIKKKNNFVITVPEGQELPDDLKINYDSFEERLVNLKLDNISKVIDYFKIENNILEYYNIFKDKGNDIYKFIDCLLEQLEEKVFKRLNENTKLVNYVEKNDVLKNIYNILYIFDCFSNNSYNFVELENYIKQKLINRNNHKDKMNQLF